MVLIQIVFIHICGYARVITIMPAIISITSLMPLVVFSQEVYMRCMLRKDLLSWINIMKCSVLLQLNQ